jgi:rhodanese-related sulfurtransferase
VPNMLTELLLTAASRKLSTSPYSGDVTAEEAWNHLLHHAAYVVDVRTSPEWTFSGIPNLSGTPSELHTISWVNYPYFEANPSFIDDLITSIPQKDAVVFFLCKTGGRSHQAANIMASNGYKHTFNIFHGFEGDQNSHQQRGCVNGWKAAGLPWTQA